MGVLDEALLRPGRIDRKIELPPSNEEGRLDILRIHSSKMNLTRGINLRAIAETLKGASGAEVKSVCTEAGMFALREARVNVTQQDLELAVAKVMKKAEQKDISVERSSSQRHSTRSRVGRRKSHEKSRTKGHQRS